MAHAIVCDRCERVAKLERGDEGTWGKYPIGWDGVLVGRNQREVLLCPECIKGINRFLEPIPRSAPE